MAILKFRIYWEEDDSVYRDLIIKHTQNFLDLHQVILKSFEFDNKHQATFFRSNDKLQRGKEITFENDFHKLWTFLVELINVNKEESSALQYPYCLRTEGFAPSQYGTKGLINEKLTEIEEKYDLNTSVLPDNYTEEGEDSEEVEVEDEEGAGDDMNEL